MSSVKGKFLRFGSALLSRANVVACADVGADFRRITMRGKAARVAPGTKVQLLLPTDDVRTYSPIASREAGEFVLLAWKHAGGPGARWVAEVAVGSEVHFAGPQPSLALPKGPVVIVGDETSVGVAASYEAERPGQVQAILQAQRPEELRSAAESVGLRPAHVAARDDASGLVEAVVAAHARAPQATLGLTGGSELVVAVRDALRARGIRNVKTKAYWIPGRTGLD
jgi:NADPH-dependent ferric siderophore reductase